MRRSFGCSADRQVADLVEEQRAAVRRRERTRRARPRARERALRVAEQVALDQRLGRRAAVEHDERPLRARRRVVDAARHQLLAGAALAEEQHRRVRLARALEDREHLAHRDRLAVERAEVIVLRRRDVDDLVGRHQLDQRLADAQRDAGRRDDLADGDAIDHGAVARAEVGDREALRVRRDRAVAARHERIGRARRRTLVGADHDAGLRQLDLEPAIRTVDDAQLRSARRAGRAADHVRDARDEHGRHLQDAAQEQLAEVAIRLEPRHAADVEDLVDRERAVDARQQERGARADRRVLRARAAASRAAACARDRR